MRRLTESCGDLQPSKENGRLQVAADDTATITTQKETATISPCFDTNHSDFWRESVGRQ